MVSNEFLLNDILLYLGMVVIFFVVYIDKNFDDKLLDLLSIIYKEIGKMVLEVVCVIGFYCIKIIVLKYVLKF